MIKKDYLQPEVDIVHLAAEESIMTGSQNGTGANASWYGDEEGFDSFFGS